MPELGPDICYSCQELLAIVDSEQLRLSDFAIGLDKVLSFEIEIVLETCQKCNWIAFDQEGRIILTDRGRQIAESMRKSEAASALRLQIASMIRTYDWVWVGALRYGREEALRRMPPDARQCFAQSLTLESSWPRQLIQWWDDLSKHQREVRVEENLEVGRHAEELSFEFERRRTGTAPEWRALESSFNGYDILSKKSKANNASLRIEVKGTSAKISDAEFWVTRHEWRTATSSGDYVFHLWSLGDGNLLSVVPFREVEKHTPIDRNKGKWENVKIKFGPFFAQPYKPLAFKGPRKMRTPTPRRVRARVASAG